MSIANNLKTTWPLTSITILGFLISSLGFFTGAILFSVKEFDIVLMVAIVLFGVLTYGLVLNKKRLVLILGNFIYMALIVQGTYLLASNGTNKASLVIATILSIYSLYLINSKFKKN